MKFVEFFKKLFSKENLKKFFRTYIWLMVLLFVIDIVTKWAVVNHFGVAAMNSSVHSESGAIPVINGFCYIGGAINDKAAFSLGPSRWVLLLISLVMTGGFIAFYVVQYKKLNTVYKVAIALMIAGGFGNLIDRAFYWPSTTGFNGVIDWIIFRFGSTESSEFAMFNIADACLVIGVILVIIEMIIEEIKAVKEKAKKGEYRYSPEELEKKKQEDEGNKSE